MSEEKIFKTRRKLLFFKVNTEHQNPFKEILQYVYNLEWNEMYTDKTKDEERIFIQSLETKDGFIQGLICWMRMSGIPKKWSIWRKDIHDIGLSEDEWITETTHFIYSESFNILVIEYNHYGPRIWSLEYHLNNRANTNEKWCVTEIDFEPILNQDTLDKLNDIWEIRMMSMSVPRKFIWNLPQKDDSIFSAITQSYHYWDKWEIMITIKNEKRKHENIIDEERVKSELKDMWMMIDENVSSLQIQAISKSDGKSKLYDFLQEKMRTEISVVRQGKSRDIDSADIFLKMRTYFNEHKIEIWGYAHYENI